MPLLLTPRPRRLTRTECVAAWICAFSLVLVLSNRFSGSSSSGATSWVASSSSRITAKVMAKDFFSLQTPPAARILLPRSTPLRVETSEAHPLIFSVLDNRLFTRPPPIV
jgi:hypothetical protein